MAALEALLAPGRALTDPRFDASRTCRAMGDTSSSATTRRPECSTSRSSPWTSTNEPVWVSARSASTSTTESPVWRRLLSNLGTVNGTRENTRQLLVDGEAVLVFPGGGREVARRR